MASKACAAPQGRPATAPLPSRHRRARFVGSFKPHTIGYTQKSSEPCRRAPTRAAAASPSSPAAAAAEQAEQAPSPLQSFLQWALANGVEGVPGSPGSKIGLYEGEGGERGVVALQEVAQGETVLQLPLRLAVTDVLDEQERGQGQEEEEDGSHGGSYGGAAPEEQPWSVRLAGKLLGMVAAGVECAWHPFLQVLPQTVPSPLTTFSWEDVQAVEYEPMRRQLDHASWLAASAAQSGGGAFDRASWDWALSVVHSRTFGAPGSSGGGGVGVRMLVPLVDMLNHAGDYVTSPPGAAQLAQQAFDNVRWDLKAPRGPGQGWSMVVAATRDIPAGEELLLSYGERPNDDFFIHYGFVPPRNPHDDVALFSDIEAAIDWWLAAFLPPGALPPQRLQLAIAAAYEAAEQQDSYAQAAEAVLAAVPEGEAEVIRAELARIKLGGGGMADGRLLAAFRSLHEAAAGAAGGAAASQAPQDSAAGGGGIGGGEVAAGLGGDWRRHVRLAVASRARELLRGMPTPLLADLQRLAAWERETGERQHGWEAALAHYAPALEAYEASHGSLSDGAAGGSGEAAAAQAGAGSAPLLDAGAADAELARLLLQQAPPAAQPAGDSGAAEEGAGGGGGAGGSMLPVLYRCYKKLILADAVLLTADS